MFEHRGCGDAAGGARLKLDETKVAAGEDLSHTVMTKARNFSTSCGSEIAYAERDAKLLAVERFADAFETSARLGQS